MRRGPALDARALRNYCEYWNGRAEAGKDRAKDLKNMIQSNPCADEIYTCATKSNILYLGSYSEKDNWSLCADRLTQKLQGLTVYAVEPIDWPETDGLIFYMRDTLGRAYRLDVSITDAVIDNLVPAKGKQWPVEYMQAELWTE